MSEEIKAMSLNDLEGVAGGANIVQTKSPQGRANAAENARAILTKCSTLEQLNALAQKHGAPAFKSMEEAKQWVELNASTIMRAGFLKHSDGNA